MFGAFPWLQQACFIDCWRHPHDFQKTFMAFVKSYLIQVLTGWLLAVLHQVEALYREGIMAFGNEKHPAKVYMCV